MKSNLPGTAQDAFDWHARPGAFERLTPTWANTELVSREGTIRPGDRARLRVTQGPLRIEWDAIHRALGDGRLGFVDEQEGGPFRSWRHEHRFTDIAPGECCLDDFVQFEMPFGDVGADFVRGKLERLFRYRHAVTRDDLESHSRAREAAARSGFPISLRVGITGSSGLVGLALSHYLTTGGHTVVRFVRRTQTRENEISWNVDRGVTDLDALASLDVVVHLAGESVLGRWNHAKKARIRNSRVAGTEKLSKALAVAWADANAPRSFVSASAIGYYGNREGEELTEASNGSSREFLAGVVREWEQAADAARGAGIRVVHPRIGLVLSHRGGALAKMLPAFLGGVAGPLGDGRHFMSWIALDELVAALHQLAVDGAVEGPVNLVTGAETNSEFTKTLAKVVRRPAFLPAPAWALRGILGQMAEETLLGSQNIVPRGLLDAGIRPRFDSLEATLRHELGRTL